MGKDEGHLIPPIWMEENKEAFDAMKAQVEREEARRSDMGVDVAALAPLWRKQCVEALHGLVETEVDPPADRPRVFLALLDLLDAKERELAVAKEALQHIANAPTPYNVAIPLAFTHCIELAATTLTALDAD